MKIVIVISVLQFWSSLKGIVRVAMPVEVMLSAE